jgi:hypothetical protein
VSAFLGLPEFIFNLIGKFSAAFLIFTFSLLFLPPQIADESVLQMVRNTYRTELWIGLLFSASLFLSYVGKSVWNFIVQQIGAYINDKKQKKKRSEGLQRILERLKSLDQRELLWIQYCLHNNQQTISCAYTDRTANSLENKGILSHGSGSALNLPYTIKDEVWAYLKTHQSEFIPLLDQKETIEFDRALRGFVDSFRIY